VGGCVGRNRRIGLIVPALRIAFIGRTLNSLTRACSSCSRIVRLSGVRFISNVPEISKFEGRCTRC
jgi:hypothetical protein